MNTSPRVRGAVIFSGPSRIDGKPIVGIVTFQTSNPKTGDMAQTWILRKHITPIRALYSGGDVSVCGDCPLRRNGCYVKVHQAPRAVYDAYRRGLYPVYTTDIGREYLRGRMIRLGSYGEPTAIPMKAWRPLLRLASGHTGYTHQWRQPRFQFWNRYLMASTHGLADNAAAAALGWRTFRTVTEDAPLAGNEIECPASARQGYRLTCERCKACNGVANGTNAKRSIVIVGHGSPSILPSINAISS